MAARAELHVANDAGKATLEADACVLALPPPQLRQHASGLRPAQQALLDSQQPSAFVQHQCASGPAPGTGQEETFVLPPVCEQAHVTTTVQHHPNAPGRAPPGRGVVSLFCRDA